MTTTEHRHGMNLKLVCDQCGTAWPFRDDSPTQCPDCVDHLGEASPAPVPAVPVPDDRLAQIAAKLDNIQAVITHGDLGFLLSELAAAHRERDEAQSTLAYREMDYVGDRDAAIRERDAAIRERDEAQRKLSERTTERDATEKVWRRRSAQLRAERDAALAQLAKYPDRYGPCDCVIEIARPARTARPW